uniref:Ig-like domain-containing protein n=1 Tax=Anabas testudineus TaxID=64144 RepID=A0A7N6FB41_ANATE
MKMDFPRVCVLQTLLVLMVLPAVYSVHCPRPCSCPQPTELHCTFRSLVSIPSAVSRLVERINLGFNSINTITDKSLAGLRKLELLMVHGNEIHSLPDGVFRDLVSLQMLKISYNKLKEIKRHTFLGLWSLTRLHLDHNQLEFIHPDAFQGLTSLRMLQLEGNQLQQLHPATFTTFTLMGHFHFSTLRHLYLSDNELTSLPSRLVTTMPQLENLYLHGNPWICDCNMRWLQDWDKTSPGVLKCKKDRALPGGQLCPMCSTPRHLQKKELQAVENLICSRPVINSPHRTYKPEDIESEVMATEDFREPFGNISLGLSDEHGNQVDLECSVGEPKEIPKISWEQMNQFQLASNVTLSVDLGCPVDREKYEQLWKLIAYYSSVPAHLQRGIMVSKEPHPTYVYRQDSEKDALYYTGVKVNMMAQPEWLMQTSADLQLNRLQSSAKMVKLILSMDYSETVKAELVRRQKRAWVIIKSANTTRKVLSVMIGSPSQMNCNVHSSGQPVIHWMLPDGSKVKAPYSSPDNRVFLSSDGQLVIRSVSHIDTGTYYCIAKVHGDLAVLPFHLTVQESSSPRPGEDDSITPIEEFFGKPINLPCMATGSPDAEINWILPSSRIISFQANSTRAAVYSNGTLHIPQAQVLDSGYYKCIAINQHGVDTLATKITVVRHKGIIRPLRKFVAEPQSASGVNTQIKVPTPDIEENIGRCASRKEGHPAIRKKSSNDEERKNIVENRRRVNMSKSKIDPEKWADILAKIRDRKAQNTVTPFPVQYATEKRITEQTTQSQEAIEGSSDGVTVPEKEGQDYLTTQHTPLSHTEIKTNKHNTQGQGTHVTSNSYTTHNIADMTSTSQLTQIIHSTAETHTMQAAYTTHDTNLDRDSTSDSVFFLPQTTSVPLHAVTFWQTNANSASSSSTSSLQENHSTKTYVDEVKTTVRSKTSERRKNKEKPNVVAIPNKRKSSGSQSISSVDPNESLISRDENGKYISEVATTPQSHSQPKDKTFDGLQYPAMLTTAYTTTTAAPTTPRRRGSDGQSPSRVRQPISRRRNGGRRNRPNRGKQKLNKNTPANAAVAKVNPTASTQLKIEPLEGTTANFNTAVPFTSSQAASSGRLSHKESTVSSHDSEVATKPSSLPNFPQGSVLPLAKPLFESTSAAPSVPTASPGVGHGKISSQTTLGNSESLSHPEQLDVFTPGTQQTVRDGPLPPVKHLEVTQSVNVTGGPVLVPHSDNSSGGFHSVPKVQTDVEDSQSGTYYTPTMKSETIPLKETGETFSLLPSSSASAASLIKHEPFSSGLITTLSMFTEGDLQTAQFTTKKPSLPEQSHSSSQNQITSTDPDIEGHLQETLEVNVDVYPTRNPITTPPFATSLRYDYVVPSTETSHFTPIPTSSTGAKIGSSLKTTTQETPRITVHHSKDQQINPIILTTEPTTPSDNQPANQSPDHTPTSPALNLTSVQTIKQTSTPAPTITSIHMNTLVEEPLLTTQSVSRMHQLPGRESIPRGKPRIHKSNFQNFTVKAETDAQLPCEAEGQPMPFLSWTILASGASIAQNTRVHRFEVHQNGTLIIRNTQPMDGGLYLCTVQNQFGTDKMEVNLVVLSQHPQVLQPRTRDITVHLGGRVDLECQVNGYPVRRVIWVLPNHVHLTAAPFSVSSQPRVAVLTNGTLRISQTTFADRGIYKCIDSSVAGVDAVSVYLDVSALPPVIQQSQSENITLPEASNAYIHCTATGAPQPVIRWLTPDGIQLTASQFVTGRNFIIFPNGTLYIRGLGPGNAGRYECSASNTAASSRRTVILSIKRNPSPSKAHITLSSPQRTDVTYGSKLLLNCVAEGEPDPRVIWRTPSKKLVDAQYSFDPRIKVYPNGTLTIQPVTDKDSGDYLCVARNKMGDDYVLLRANVLTTPAKIEQKQQRSSQEVIYGGNLKMDCVASGLPNPEISWALPDGTMVNLVKQREGVSGGRTRRYVVFDNGTLYFNDVGMPEEGDYTCYAVNQLGKDEMKVRVKVKAATSPPKIQNDNQKVVRVFYGEAVKLTCNAKGEPMPVTTWISPINRVISPALDKYQVLDDGTLVVQKVQRFDAGNYTCITRNSAGQDHKVIRLEVLVTPPVINGIRGAASAIKVTAVPDQRKLVDCLAKGTPTPRIMWVLPGNVILPAPYYSNRMTVHPNGTLEIRSAKRTDSGQLVCIARNEGGEVRLVVSLDVKEVVMRPQIQASKTDNLSLTVGKTMTLNCSFENLTLPHVTWVLPNGTPLLSGARFSKFFHRPDGSLIISNPSVGESGMYRCQGQFSGGLAEHKITLFPGRKPEINNRYNSPVTVMNGETLLLHCLTSGKPHRLTWTLPSGVVLNKPQRAGRYSVLHNGTLAVQQAAIYDRGSYVCRAANEYGSSVHSVSVIVIAYPPRITNAPPSVTYAKRGVAIQLNCVATGIPKVDIAWETPDKTRLAVSVQPRLFGNKYLQPQGSLIIQNPTQKDAGIYRCTARNAIGTDSKTTFLNVF